MHIGVAALTSRHVRGELKAGRSKKRLVVICHGYQSSSAHPALVAITEGLNQRGHATFTFDFSKGSELDLEQQANDIVWIAEHFREYQEIVLCAGSFGALSAVIATLRSPRIGGLVTINGFFGSSQLGARIRRTFRIFRLLTLFSPRHSKMWRFYKQSFRPAKIVVPTLVVHAKHDEVVLFGQSRHFFDTLTAPKTFEVLMDADHNLSAPADVATVITVVDAWLRQL